jgi:hypothetical protein
MNKVIRCLITLFFGLFVTQLVLLLSCGDRSTTGPNGRTTRLYGLVTDIDGNALEDVGIHLIFSFEDQISLSPSSDDITHHGAAPQMPPPPSEFKLYQNFPNPFNPETTIRFDLPLAVHVSLVVLDIMDREILRLVDSDLEAGAYVRTWDGTNQDGQHVSNGVYTYQIVAEEFSEEKQMCLNMLDPEHIRSLGSLPVMNTDHQGRFMLEYSSVPLGETILHTDEQGEALGELVISDVSVVLIKEGFLSVVQNLPSDQRRFLDVHYVLIAE